MRLLASLFALVLPAALSAHPHVFVDSRIEVLTDGRRVTGLRLTWTYDEFFTLFLLEELGLDPEADAILSEDELAILQANVTDWPAEFTGDLVLTHGEEPVPLGPRRDHQVTVADGRLVETHLRPLSAPVDAAAAPVTIENYDPYYYVAYTVLPDIAVAAPCEAMLRPADLLTAQAEVDRIFGELDIAGAGPEVQLPPVGYAFTDRVEVRCVP